MSSPAWQKRFSSWTRPNPGKSRLIVNAYVPACGDGVYKVLPNAKGPVRLHCRGPQTGRNIERGVDCRRLEIEKKQPAERMTLKKADELFSAFVLRIAKANSNRKFAFFLQEALVYGSYMNRENDTVGDIDIAINFAMKTQAKLDTRIAFYMRRDGVDWKGGYNRAINEVSESIIRSKHFHQADVEFVKRSFPYRVVYEMPE